MEGLSELRKKIDGIDRELAGLFEKRMELSEKIGALKAGSDGGIYDREREEQMMGKFREYMCNEALSPYFMELMQCIMKLSKQYQETVYGALKSK